MNELLKGYRIKCVLYLILYANHIKLVSITVISQQRTVTKSLTDSQRLEQIAR